MIVKQPFYHCMSNEFWETQVRSSDGKSWYTVSFGRAPDWSVVEKDFSCTCKAFEFKKTYCKHIEQVIAERRRCGWMQFHDGGKPGIKDGAYVCPKCGGPVKCVMWGV